MAFVTSQTVVLGAGVAVTLPIAVDISGNIPGFLLYSHIRVPGGTTYTYDTGQVLVIPASTDTVAAIPPGARTITATAASTAQFGSASGQ